VTTNPAASADSLFWLDTLEYLIPVLPLESIQLIMPVVRGYLSLTWDVSLRAQLESAHSVFLAILARGAVPNDQIPAYINQVYSVPTLLKSNIDIPASFDFATSPIDILQCRQIIPATASQFNSLRLTASCADCCGGCHETT
jgi:hypothetical protein